MRALVTGASRGIGLEVAKQLRQLGYEVFITSRERQSLREALRKLGSPVNSGAVLDFVDLQSVERFATTLRNERQPFHVLVNNAGVYLDRPGSVGGVRQLRRSVEALSETLSVNCVAPAAFIHACLPGMLTQGYGRIVNVSSGMGRWSEMSTSSFAYSASKLLINALTSAVAKEFGGGPVLVNAVCPGWVSTDMGGPHAPRTVAEAAEGILWACTLDDDGPNGGFFRDKHPLDFLEKTPTPDQKDQ